MKNPKDLRTLHLREGKDKQEGKKMKGQNVAHGGAAASTLSRAVRSTGAVRGVAGAECLPYPIDPLSLILFLGSQLERASPQHTHLSELPASPALWFRGHT